MVECPEVVYWQGRADLCFVALPLIPTHFCLLGVLSARTGWPHEFGRRGIRTSLRASLTLDIHEVCADGRAGARCFERSNPAMLRQNTVCGPWPLPECAVHVHVSKRHACRLTALCSLLHRLAGCERSSGERVPRSSASIVYPSGIPLHASAVTVGPVRSHSRALHLTNVSVRSSRVHTSRIVARTVRLVLGKTVHTACDGQSVCVCELCKCGLKPHAR